MPGRKSSKKKRDAILAFAFTAPSLLLFVMFMIIPIFGALYLSFTKWTGAGPIKWIGINNYISLLNHRDFWISFKNSLVLIALHLGFQLTLALFFSYLLFRTKPGMRFFRSVFFLPTVISATAIGVMFSLLFNADLGPINIFLKSIGLGKFALPWLANKTTVLFVVSFIIIWQFIGYHVVIILAGMKSIPDEVIESAVIDGANTVVLFFRVILPLIKDMLQVSLIFMVTGCLKAFDHSYVMTAGGPGVSSSFLAVYMYKQAYSRQKLGLGSAAGLVILLLAFIFTRLINWFFYHKDEESVT